MTIQEFSDQFDVLYNNITSNQAPGLDEYEKSLFLTKAEKEIVKNYFTANSKGNNIGQGFDDSAKRQADFSVLMKTDKCKKAEIVRCTWEDSTEVKDVFTSAITLVKDGEPTVILSWDNVPEDTVFNVTGTTSDPIVSISGVDYRIKGFPFDLPDLSTGTLQKIIAFSAYSKIDPRSGVYSFPDDTFIIVNESIYTTDKRILQVIPLRYDEYTRLMSKPFQRPLKHQVWRLMNSGDVVGDKGAAVKYVEIVANTWDENKISEYNIRYVRVPKPIIVAPLGDLSIDGEHGPSNQCEIDPILHEDILQRAVELAKVAWTATGQDNAQMVLQAGQRSE